MVKKYISSKIMLFTHIIYPLFKQVICSIAKGTPDDVNRAVEAAKVNSVIFHPKNMF